MIKKFYLSKKSLNILYRTFSSQPSLNVINVLNTKNVGDHIEIKGWVKSLRKQKENTFIDLSDGSTDKKLQIFVPQNLNPGNLTTGSSITAKGALTLSPKGQIELTAENVEVYSDCVVTEGYPFAPRKQYTQEYIRQYLHFRPRTNKFASILRVRSATTLAIQNFFHDEGYFNVHTPILTSNDCEGAGEVFRVIPDSTEILKSMHKEGINPDESYFNTKAFLAVSGQLHLEAAAHGLSKVYTFGPTFRAENTRSRLHLSEFYMLEAETAFVDDLQEIILFIEKLVKGVTKNVLNKNADDIAQCYSENSSDFSWVDKKFPVISYQEASEILKNNRGKYKEEFDEKNGFAKEHEIFLVNHCGGTPTFVINWPKDMKPFYMRECTDNPNNVAALDLLAPGIGEIVGGSLRENDLHKLKEKIPGDQTKLKWYLDLRKFGGVPTGGFGLGFERYLQLLLGISNIKDTIPFPRWPHNCDL